MKQPVPLVFVLSLLGAGSLFGQTNDSAAAPAPGGDAAPLVVGKFWHPWLNTDSPASNFIIPTYAVTEDGVWIGGYFNQADKGRIFKVSLPDLKTEGIDTADGKEITSMVCSSDALYASYDRFVNHLMIKDGMARYDLSAHTWSVHQLGVRFKQDFYIVNGSLYLDAMGSSDAPPSPETAILKYDWDADKTTLLASTRRRPGQNQFDDTAAYQITGIFAGPGNKPCVTTPSGTYYINESPGNWEKVFDGTFSDLALTIFDQTLVLNSAGDVTLMDPKTSAPVPLMTTVEPEFRGAPAKSLPPWAGQTLWDSPGKEAHIWTNSVGYHGDTLYILKKPREKGGTFQLLCFQKGQGRTPRGIPLKFQLDATAQSSIPPRPGHIPNGWSTDELEHPDTSILPPILITTKQGLCVKLFSVGFWFISYDDIDAYLKSAPN